MRHVLATRFVSVGIMLMTGAAALYASEAPAKTPTVNRADSRKVIVIMQDQMPELTPARSVEEARGQVQARAGAIAEAQSPVIAQLQSLRPHTVHSFKTINAFATTVSTAEAELLSKNPQVRAVVDDVAIRLYPAKRQVRENGPGGNASPAKATALDTASLCHTLEPEALQLTNTAFLDPTTPQAQLLSTGAGVRVAFIADGLDINNPDFIRPDGSHVFIDYQDFTGDAINSPTAGGEAFGDASSIAAQGRQTYDLSQFVNSAHPLPPGCNIQIRGMAPDASLIGLVAFSQDSGTTSAIVQAIEYAVSDSVNVINESFGANNTFDSDLDPISLANKAAYDAGVTVVASSGDAGSAGTIGSPATDSYVISVGASTQFRLYAQTSYGVQGLATGGFLSNNMSSLSSGGFAELSARTVDVVAPGDLGWALCTANTVLYSSCVNFNGNPSSIEAFGGTSQASPYTAGEAALVIQAYESAHGGARPTPALVKQIIMSTATDLGFASYEQGAGLINALAAVNEAASIHDADGSPARQGSGLEISATSAQFVAAPDKHESKSFTITNTGATTRHIEPLFETLGPKTGGTTVTIQLTPNSDPVFTSFRGDLRAYQTRTFTVPAGSDHLDAAVAWKVSTGDELVYLALIDPNGRQAAYSLPQGIGNGYGRVDVMKPLPGPWTAVIFTQVSNVLSYTGPVKFSWSSEKFSKFGSASPSAFDLAAGASKTVSTSFTMPSDAGDLATALRFGPTPAASAIPAPEVPISLRTIVPIGAHGGSFTGKLTGGNGRAAVPTQSYEFDVPSGTKDLSLSLSLADPGYRLEGFLVDPNGMQLSVQPNIDPVTGAQLPTMQLFHQNPAAGLWHFILMLNYLSSGNQTSISFTAHIALNGAKYSAPGLPNSSSTTLSASKPPVTIPITVTNTGSVTEVLFADSRLYDHVFTQLPIIGPCGPSENNLPGACAYVYVPTQADHVQFSAVASVPITMDAANDIGFGNAFTDSPDIWAANGGTGNVTATLATPEVPWGFWLMNPAEVGPFGGSAAPAGTVSYTASASMRPFDTAMSSNTGDFYPAATLGAGSFSPLIVAPGSTGIINLTITPDSTQVGKIIQGFVYIDNYSPTLQSGDEVIRIPYEYTVAP